MMNFCVVTENVLIHKLEYLEDIQSSQLCLRLKFENLTLFLFPEQHLSLIMFPAPITNSSFVIKMELKYY